MHTVHIAHTSRLAGRIAGRGCSRRHRHGVEALVMQSRPAGGGQKSCIDLLVRYE